MHLCVLPDHQNQVIKKLFFSPLEWLKTCFDAFPDYQNQVLKKLFFNVWSGYKLVLMHILTTRIKSLKNYFSRLGWLKTCFDAFPENQNQVIKKLFFNVWFKTCFVAFPDHQNQVLQKLFFTSGLVKNVFLCICAYFQTTKIKSLKNYFFHLWSG
jgi:hypothetical protein